MLVPAILYKDEIIKNLKRQLYEKEYIERDKLYKFIELFDAQYGDNIVFTKKELKHLIDIFPSADVAPVRHGEWI